MNDMTPEVRIMEDGSMGYFYTPQQLYKYQLDKITNTMARAGRVKATKLPPELQSLIYEGDYGKTKDTTD